VLLQRMLGQLRFGDELVDRLRGEDLAGQKLVLCAQDSKAGGDAGVC
jgi:hypothetical protein